MARNHAPGSVRAFFFSPTGTARRVVMRVAESAARASGLSLGEPIDCTTAAARARGADGLLDGLGPGDLVVAGLPVYAGRVPNVLLPFLRTLRGNGAAAVAVACYGNRHYDDALVELADLLGAAGFRVIAAGTFACEHAFSRVLAAGRPDEADLAAADRLGALAAERLVERYRVIETDSPFAIDDVPLALPGERPYRPYYRPKDSEGRPVDFRPILPVTSSACVRCGLCSRICPMGSIDPVDPATLAGICVKCCACVKACPVGAKSFVDAAFVRHASELERDYAARREPELF